MADKGKERRMTSGTGNTTTSRGFTLDRFEQEVASEIGLGANRMHVTGRQGTVGKQDAVRTARARADEKSGEEQP
ncbi:MAG: hypothetical protein ACM3XN_10490 [Chloroflexota bacterium]